jgi:hypothetical protein
MSKKIIKLKIGQELYRYSKFYHIMRYEVFGILQREEGEYYQIVCKNCNHLNWNCEVLIKLSDENEFKYVSMLNDREENPQYHFHITDFGECYCLTKKEALEKLFYRRIELLEEQIKEKKKEIIKKKEKLTEFKEQLKALT